MKDRHRRRRHIVIAQLEDRPGALNRIVSRCRQRSFDIESLVVGRSETPGLLRMTLVVDGEVDAEQVVHQLGKLVDVLDIRDVSNEDTLVREMALIKVRWDADRRTHITEVVRAFRARIVDVAPTSVIVEVTGDEDKVDALVRLLQDYGIIEMVRTGRVAMVRGSVPSHPPLEPMEETYEYCPVPRPR
ncbi:MAG: acetolactate synthase small subunit [Acidobacteria bacterium]|nr:acetolactate synthase small subunit [Acidobacteriota bacterium]MDW7983449.1 acetolactate synthase small subunit [Acidobacteriota bacterium]